MKVEVIDDGAIIDGLQKVANRITLGLILAAMIISAAMVMRIDTSFRIMGYPGFAMILFTLAFVGAAYLAFQIIRHDRRSSPVTPVSYRIPRPRRRTYPYRQPLRRRPSYRRGLIPGTPSRKASPPSGRTSAGCYGRGGPGHSGRVLLDQRNGGRPSGLGSGQRCARWSTPGGVPAAIRSRSQPHVGDPEFINTMSGAAGVPFVAATRWPC